MKRISVIAILLLVLTSCNFYPPQPHSVGGNVKVALLLEGMAFDQGWDSQAYHALIEIEKNMGARVTYIENVNSDEKKRQQTLQLAKEGYQLIFGNGRAFEFVFNELAPRYPNSHFIFFNGCPEGKNVTSVNFVPESIGYFSGMTAGLMTKTHKIGLIPAFDNMKEIPTFTAAVKEQNPLNIVYVKAVNDWNDKQEATLIANEMIKNGVDILVPMGDSYCIDVIMAASNAKIHAIGFVSDQSFIDQKTVLTSTIEDLTGVYLDIAKKHENKTLQAGCLYKDFKEGAQRMAPFSQDVPEEVQQKIKKRIQAYNEGTFVLPVIVNKGTGDRK